VPWWRRSPKTSQPSPAPTAPTDPVPPTPPAPAPLPRPAAHGIPQLPPLTLLDAATEGGLSIRSLFESTTEQRTPLGLVVGMADTGPATVDLAQTRHLLIAGAPPVMRDALVHAVVLSVLFQTVPGPVQALFIDGDPATAALDVYSRIPHLITPVITSPQGAGTALRWTIHETERRMQLAQTGAESLDGVASRATWPACIVLIHEFAGIIQAVPDMEGRLVWMLEHGAEYGMHIVLSTQLAETTTLAGIFPAALKHRVPAKILWRGESLAEGPDRWALQVPSRRSPQPFRSAWVTAREAGRIADFFADPGSVSPAAERELDTLTGVEFETWLRAWLQTKGWQLDVTPTTGDFGADLVGYGPDGASWVIQAKRWTGPVGVEAVQQVLGALAYYQTQHALLITTAPLTKAAEELSRRSQVTVWTRDTVLPAFVTWRDSLLTRPADLVYSPTDSRESGSDFGEIGTDTDTLFPAALRIVVQSRQASASMLQRRLRIGYTRAMRLVDQMAERGYVGPQDGARPRDVYLTLEQYQRLFQDVEGA
jgi:DNA segregation ATPase FtsK/SpoIIIE-like protein